MLTRTAQVSESLKLSEQPLQTSKLPLEDKGVKVVERLLEMSIKVCSNDKHKLHDLWKSMIVCCVSKDTELERRVEALEQQRRPHRRSKARA